MGNGFCQNGTIKCPNCKEVWAGIAIGGYYKLCEFCSGAVTCEYRQENYTPMQKSFQLCPICLIYLLLGGQNGSKGVT